MKLRKLIFMLFILFAGANLALATTYTVCSSGCDYRTIQICENAAGGGDTCLVKNGIYQENVDVDTAGLTIKSENEWGAVMDGNKSMSYAFKTTAANIKIIGFKIQNYSLTASNSGVVDVYGGTGVEIKYNYFTSNTIGYNDTGCIMFRGGGGKLARGNVFTGNTYPGGGTQNQIVSHWDTVNTTIELNKFLDTGGSWAIYWTKRSNSVNIRYNYFKKKARIRLGKLYTVQHNIFETMLEMHEQNFVRNSGACPKHPEWIGDGLAHEDYDADLGGCYEDADEQHNTTYNTYYGANEAIRITSIDDSDFTYNLFINNTWGTYAKWGLCSSPQCTDLVFNYNHYDNVTNRISNLNINAYTERNYTTGSSGYNSSTGCNTLSPARGANLKISVWPFTDCSDEPLQTDYPYSDRSRQTLPKEIEPNAPTGLRILN